ncbi:hypothetical protein Tco_1413547, partial [Tanacetum coccineum]
MQNSSGQVVTVTTDNAPVMGEPTRPIRDIRGLDEGIVLDESVKTHNMEIHTSTNAGVVSRVCKKRRIDAGNISSYNEVNRDRIEIEELRAMVEELKRERDMLVCECTELRGKVEDHERELLSCTNKLDRVLADRQDFGAEVASLERE